MQRTMGQLYIENQMTVQPAVGHSPCYNLPAAVDFVLYTQLFVAK